MEAIVMRLYLKGNIRAIDAGTALMDNVLPSLLSLDGWDIRAATPRIVIGTERESGNEVHFTIEQVR